MQRSAALRLLSSPHAELIALADCGFDAAGIAERLSLDVGAVGPALAVARAKLASLEAREQPAWARDTGEPDQ